MWLAALIGLSWLFSLALTAKEREKAMRAREDLVTARSDFSKQLLEMQVAYNRDMAELSIENAQLKGEF